MSYSIETQLIVNNRSQEPLTPQGFVIHATATPGATAQNEHDYFNAAYRAASAHYIVDWLEIIRLIPESEKAWHAGPTANSKFLSVEMCEPQGTDAAKFQEVWDRTIWLVADACVRHGWSTGPNVFSHRGISAMYHETNHTDPIEYLARYAKTWEQLLGAIDTKIDELKQSTPQPIPSPSPIPAPAQPQPVALKFSYPNNAKVVNDYLYIRDVNGIRIPGRYVSKGNDITVLDVSYSKQLVLVEYPTASGVRSGYVTNATNCIQYYYQSEWHNGSTLEPVMDENGAKIGSLDPRESATPLYRREGKLHVVYTTQKGKNTKSGYVAWDGGFRKF